MTGSDAVRPDHAELLAQASAALYRADRGGSRLEAEEAVAEVALRAGVSYAAALDLIHRERAAAAEVAE